MFGGRGMIPRKNLVSIPIIVIMVLSTFTSIIPDTAVAYPHRTLHVGGSGPGNYTTIQDAIDNANDGDTVFVYNGTYYENVIVNKTINLVGQDRRTTIINANGKEDAVYISANSVNISCFTLANGGTTHEDAGIDIHSNYNTIKNNNISLNRDRGIGLWSSNGNIITGNLFTKNSAINIYLYHSSNNSITKNTVAGINSVYCVYLDFSNDNKIYHNNFINNTPHQATDYGGTNSWDNGYPNGGNFWDNYTGVDLNHDGIGDTPYNITGGSSQDRYPLMYPFGNAVVSIDDGSACYCTTDTVYIRIHGVTDLASGTICVTFNNTVVEKVKIAHSSWLTGIYYTTGHNYDGINGIRMTGFFDEGTSGDIIFAGIVFHAIGNYGDSTILSLAVETLVDSQGNPIEYSVEDIDDGIFTVLGKPDLNGDGFANILDLIIIVQHWGETGSPCWVSADVNCDGVINILDMVLVGQHWTG